MRRNAGGKSAILAWPGSAVQQAFLLRVRLRLPPIDIAGWFADQIDQRRLFLLVPVLLMVGIGVYFAADGEPNHWAVMGLIVVPALFLYPVRQAFMPRLTVLAALLVATGFAAASFRTWHVAAERIDTTIVADVSGQVLSVEKSENGMRLLVAVNTLTPPEWYQGPTLLQRIRVGVKKVQVLAAGDTISFRARLMPPSPAALPGGYDFEREAYFQQIGAVGTALRDVAISKPHAGTMAGMVDRWRQTLTERIATVIGGQAGALSAALVTGKRALLTEQSNDALRAAGLYHIVSISGLHMVLVAGAIFFFVRSGLALFSHAAKRWPIKKIAACASLLGTAAYCIFSGAEVATVRSLVMTGVMLCAILVDRPALSMRNVAIAASLILLLEPETMLGPSFQMSFAAVTALVAAHEAWSRRWHRKTILPLHRKERSSRWIAAIGRFLLGLAATTIVATLATAPFGISHFHKINSYGLAGNMLAVPLVSFIVMPSALLGVLLYPLGLDRPVWMVMGAANDWVLQLAATIARWDQANIALPASPTALFLFLAALFLVAIPIGRMKFVALLPGLTGLLFTLSATPPSVVASHDGSSVLVVDAGAHPILAGPPPGDFVLDQWLAASGLPPDTKPIKAETNGLCDAAACIVTLGDGRSLSIVRSSAAFEKDCLKADLIITTQAAPPWCKPRNLLLASSHFKQHGATTVRLAEEKIELDYVRSGQADRPWYGSADQ
jgi:competence protein ComEC